MGGLSQTAPQRPAARAAVEILKAEGVTHLFGLPGAAINPFYSAMRTNGGLTHILARHVEGASQRVQEDTMKFAETLEGLGTRLIDGSIRLEFDLELAFGVPPETKTVGKGPATLGSVPYAGATIATSKWAAPSEVT